MDRAAAATSTQTLNVATTLTDWSEVLAFDQFDSSLGTLTSVEITLSGTATTSIFLDNQAEGASEGTVSTRVRWRLSDPSSLIGTPTGNKINMFLPDIDGAFYSLASGEEITLGEFTDFAVWNQTFTGGSVLTEFTGVGTIGLTLSTLTGTVLENEGGNTTAVQTTTANGTVTVVYTYETVPEPTTALLVGVSGAFLLLARRCRKG